MSKLTRRESLVLGGAVLGGVVAAGASVGAANGAGKGVAGAGTQRAWKHTSSREVIRARYFPNFTLTTHEGKKVRFYDDVVKDKVVLLNFMYASCDRICPRVTDNLVHVQDLLGARVGSEVFMYSLTLDPKHDTPAVLADYVKMHYVGSGWTFLTGHPAEMEQLRRRLGFVDPDPARDRDRENHIGNVRYGNEARQLWGACPGLSRPEFIVESLGWVTKPA